jgi:hypothetical protein
MPPFVAHFAALPDPRVDRTQLHTLLDILVIALCMLLRAVEFSKRVRVSVGTGRSYSYYCSSFCPCEGGSPKTKQPCECSERQRNSPYREGK